MVTESKYPTAPRDLYGLSTDSKPTDAFLGLPVTNGSTFLEIDTSDVYIYDAVGQSWSQL